MGIEQWLGLGGSEEAKDPEKPIPGVGGEARENRGPAIENRPIEPEKRRLPGARLLKVLVFAVFLGYVLVSYYREPILRHVGSYLVVAHPAEKSDLIVCLMGRPVERGLTAAEAYREGLAPAVYVGREALPEGYEVLRRKAVPYPETRDLLCMMLRGLGVPPSDCIVGERVAGSTYEEARVIRDLVEKRRCRSIIVVTSPTHTRRAWLTFERVFKGLDVRIRMMPSTHSAFRPESWWKSEACLEEVMVEYQKLIYYAFAYFL